MILVAGEALIDLSMAHKESANPSAWRTPLQLQGTVGGGPLNTAITASRLGESTAFLGAISQDPLGDRIIETLRGSHVDESFIQRNDLPSMLSVASLDAEGKAQYVFYMDGVSNTQLSVASVEEKLRETEFPRQALFGGLGLNIEPSADDLVQLADTLYQQGTIVMVDPNIRPQGIRDARVLAQRCEKIFESTSIVKLSDEDAEFFTNPQYYDRESVLVPWLQRCEDDRVELPDDGALSAVLLTRGSEGITVLTREHKISVPAVPNEVVDTIGAGDSVNGAILAWLASHNIDSADQISSLTESQWKEVLHMSMKVAAITVSRAGANPPWKHEL